MKTKYRGEQEDNPTNSSDKNFDPNWWRCFNRNQLVSIWYDQVDTDLDLSGLGTPIFCHTDRTTRSQLMVSVGHKKLIFPNDE